MILNASGDRSMTGEVIEVAKLYSSMMVCSKKLQYIVRIWLLF